MRRLASLPMYDLPALRVATDAWWSGVARHLRDAGIAEAPEHLVRSPDPMADWQSPDLLLSQTCGYPLTHVLAGSVQMVATPCYNATGCQGAWYASVLLVSDRCKAESLAGLAGAIAVINSPDSQSGCHVLRYMVATLADRRIPFFKQVRASGNHVASVAAIAAGQADVAAVDAVTHTLLERHAPGVLDGTRVLEVSPRMPGLPYITRRSASPACMECLRAGLAAAAADPKLLWARRQLLIGGFDILSNHDYVAITDMENQARASGLPPWG